MSKLKIPDILNLLKKGQFKSAEDSLKKLIKTNPKDYTYQNLLAIIYASQKKYKISIKILKQITKLSPKFVDAHINLGNIYNDCDELQKSAECFQRAISINPDHLIAKFNLACVLDKQDLFNKSESIYKYLITKDPRNIDFLTNYSSNQIKNKKTLEAKKIINKILKIDSNNTKAITNLGVIQKDNGKYKESINYFKKALSINSNSSEAYYNLGTIMEYQEDFVDAISYFTKAIEINPAYAEAHYNLGCVFERFGKMNKALLSYKNAIKYKKNYTKAFHNLARSQLAVGDFLNGWKGHELRKEGTTKAYKILGIKKENIWIGNNNNNSLIVHGEQGIGDEILYSSMFHDLTKHQADITITVDDRIISLMQRSFPKVNIVSRYRNILTAKSSSTQHILAGSLGQVFRNSKDDFKRNKKNWLIPCPNRSKKFKKYFSKVTKIKVGLSWKSSGVKSSDRNISLTQLTSFFPSKYFEIINLQYGNITNEKNMLEKKKKRKLIYFNDFDYKNDFENLAALISNCDFVVSIANATAHLSGAIGTPTLVLVPADSQWYWYSKNKTSLWYPKSKLFRQKTRNEWNDVLHILKNEILLLNKAV